jgi:uncharacterized Ntn-hydrolase superfamily protein
VNRQARRRARTLAEPGAIDVDDIRRAIPRGQKLTETLLMSTFSIVAADVDHHQVGVAVQSKYFAVGAVVPWARAGVGAVATQALGLANYGPKILDLLAGGANAAAALKQALASDPLASRRQIGVVRADGEAASHTGSECLSWAGGRAGSEYAVQGNILAGPDVVEEMVRAFTTTSGTLAERLVASLEAGQAAGGDSRGQQSAAVIVEQAGYRDLGSEGIDRVVDLRVDDHPSPIVELRRLLGLRLRQEVSSRAMRHYNQADFAAAAAVMAAGDARFPHSADILYNLACFESLSGDSAGALRHLSESIALDPSFRALAEKDTDFDPVRTLPAFLQLVAGA